MTSVTIRKENKPLAILLVAEYIKDKFPVTIVEGAATNFSLGSIKNISRWSSICRMLARTAPDTKLYGDTALQRTEVDHWLEWSFNLDCTSLPAAIDYLDQKLTNKKHLSGESLSLADIAVWSVLRGSNNFSSLYAANQCPKNVKRYYDMLSNLKHFRAVDSAAGGAGGAAQGKKAATASKKPGKTPASAAKGGEKKVMKEEGKFIELPGAEMGKVVVRFPPEASGFLHIGHAKAALLNQYYQQAFNGKLIMRFDDTNPAKENAEFEKVILEDLEMLGIKPDMFTHTSDLFDTMIEYAEKMIKDGKAYVDDTDPESMKKEREERVESANRSNSVEKNMKMWKDMKAGTGEGLKCCLRAKLDMKSDNGCMRDPTIYRCKPEPHVRTGTKYKVYPTYDFACPIVDSLEGVTHALRTTEYHDRDVQYYWFAEVMGLRKPYIWEYSRLNLQNTVMSKRKLTWFVDQGLVDGWSDPRLPTVRGVLRRGMTVQGLKEFVIAQGSSRSVNMMEWDKIWAVNKKVIDPVVPRFTALEKEKVVPVFVKGISDEVKEVQKHPKDPAVGMKKVYYSSKTFIEGADAECLKVGEKVTFINWGNLIISNIRRNADGKITALEADSALDDRDYKKTTKVTWLAASAPSVLAVCVHYDNLISKGVLAKDEDFKQYINHNSKSEQVMMGDPELESLKKGDIIQLQRRGYYICDSPYQPPSAHISRASPCVLLNIPDGHTKEMPTAGSKHSEAQVSKKEAAQNKKGKKAEKSPQEETAPSVVGGDATAINQQIIQQGDQVRKLKGEKASKEQITAAVNVLLGLKGEYKKVTGQEWKQGCTPPPAPATATATATSSSPASAINDKITAQGDKIRQLKAEKAEKNVVTAEVNVLLALKAEYKAATGQDWKQGCVPPAAAAAASTGAGDNSASSLNQQVTEQGNKVRDLKAAKASKDDIKKAVDALLALKAEYKKVTGSDWKPGVTPAPAPAPAAAPAAAAPSSDLDKKISAQGDKVRDMKAAKASKAELKPEIDTLLALKAEYKKVTGSDWKPGAAPAPAPAAPAPAAAAPSGAAGDLDQKIVAQGDKIRDMKGNRASKAQLKPEVDTLLSLKAEYKKVTGSDWKPGAAPAPASAPTAAPAASSGPAADIDQKISAQGDKIRDMKAAKASKAELKPEIDALLALKAEYKKVTGSDWKPGAAPAPTTPAPAAAASKGDGDKLKQEIATQEEDVRKMKAELEKAVKSLENLKSKSSTTSTSSSAPSGNMADSEQATGLKAKVDEQGNKVRSLKAAKANKADIDSAVKQLLALKLEYKELTGQDVPPAAGGGGGGGRQKKEKQAKPAPAPAPAPSGGAEGGREVKKVTRLGMEVKKEDNLAEWYSQVIVKAELIEYYDVSGCYVFRPWSFGIWERISAWFDAAIKKMGFENCYFPIFVSNSALEKEKEHIADFAPEVAWVTRSGQSELAEPIAIRPTSETVMYPSYSKWVQSHRDLPIKLNQWCSVVRWEFKHPQPFLRTREFLWQEGHSAYATYEEAEKEVYQIIDHYENIYENLLAIPVVKGRKTDKERFAGGDFTTTVEAYIAASGRGIQAATSHHLGQNFSKMFDISFEDPETKEKKFAYQNSWAITTRSIGVIVMVHGDNKGLVLPPRIAQYQVVVVPCGITVNLGEEERQKLYGRCDELVEDLEAAGIRVKKDYRDNYSPGWKFNHWELKGVPVRIELGPKDLGKQQLVAVRRFDGKKQILPLAGAGQAINTVLDEIHNDMFSKAKKELDDNKTIAYTFDDFCAALDRKNVILSPFCGEPKCEEKVKKDSARDAVVEEGAPAMGAKGLCIPFKQPKDITPQDKCVCPGCPNKPIHYTLFGRSY